MTAGASCEPSVWRWASNVNRKRRFLAESIMNAAGFDGDYNLL